MTTATTCESCGMPLPTDAEHALGDPAIPYCQYCTNDAGELDDFEIRFDRMVQWSVRKDGLEQSEAEEQTRAYMRTMPAWKDHPRLKA